MKKLVAREEYINWLYRWKNKDVIKVISGIRRCGKSTLLRMFADTLINSGIDSKCIISLNMEDLTFSELTDYRNLYEYILTLLQPDEVNYIFLDEIQLVEGFERAVDSLMLQPNCDVYITGSNAYLMSSELATLLTGRYVELKMLPLSFKEFFSAVKTMDPTISAEKAFELYRLNGSFPFILNILDDSHAVREYLQDVYNSILLKDVVQRLRVGDVSLLQRLTQTITSCIGSLVSPHRITNTLISHGRKIDQKTVDKYLDGLTDSLLFYEVARWNIKGRQVLARQKKFYIADSGFYYLLQASSEQDLGYILENIIYLELLRRGYRVYVGATDNTEIDFVAQRNDELEYIQVTASMLDPNTRNRELNSFSTLKDAFKKTVITLDRIGLGITEEGIQVVNALDWLLG